MHRFISRPLEMETMKNPETFSVHDHVVFTFGD